MIHFHLLYDFRFICRRLHSSTTEPSNNENQSTDSRSALQSSSVDNPKTIDKCPVCFMIFPFSMSPDKRAEHIDEHYSDD